MSIDIYVKTIVVAASYIHYINHYNHTMIIASIGATNPKTVPSFADNQQLYITYRKVVLTIEQVQIVDASLLL